MEPISMKSCNLVIKKESFIFPYIEMKNLFEIHITTSDIREAEISKFESFCHSIDAKPIIIELSEGKFHKQPMISKVIKCYNEKGLISEVERLIDCFKNENYPVLRTKIEIPLENEKDCTHFFQKDTIKYFEWHGKIVSSELDTVSKICSVYQAKLSANALKNDTRRRFITIRDFESSESIKSRIETLKVELSKINISIEKEEAEYCIYDSNKELDQGWIN